MFRTIEEIQLDMTNIVDGAVGRSLTDEEVSKYEGLESELKNTQKTLEIRNRDKAYNTVTIPAGVPSRHGVASDEKSDEYKGFVNYLRTGVGNADIAHLRNAQGEGVSTAGGYLVPTEFRQKIVEARKAYGGFIQEAEQLNTSDGRPIEYPTNDDTLNLGTITPEHAVFDSGADLVFGQVELGAYKYTSSGANDLPLRVSVELLQDSAFDMESLVSRKLGERIHRKQSRHAMIGTGVGEPLGILASSLTSDEDLDVADVVDYDDLLDLQDQLDEGYENNAKWLMRKNTWSQIRGLVDLNGRPLIQEANASIQGRPTRTLLGAPVIIDEDAPLLSSAAITYPIAYGDFREAYIWRKVSTLVVVVNPYSRANYGEVEFTAWERADGVVQNRQAYKIMRNNT
jgi:HK97 family phage major capsid protein